MGEFKITPKLKSLGANADVVLAPYTTWKVGGPADLFLQVNSSKELADVIIAARESGVPVTVLGWGSNVLISDKGISGLVVRNSSQAITVKGPCKSKAKVLKPDYVRLKHVDTKKYYSFADVEYAENDLNRVEVIIESGVSLQQAINYLLGKGITGLQWFSGIPGTIGGAIFNNIHGGTRFIAEFVISADVLTDSNEILTLPAGQLEFDYDHSRFQHSDDVILSVTLCLGKGDIDKAKTASVEWARKKKLQPYNSAGCCFQNLSEEEQNRLKLESNSWGYIIDKVLNLKGKRIGGAQISTKHAAFIENTGNATAADILALFTLIHDKAKQKLGVTPKSEIFFLGFSPEEVSKFR